MNLLDKLVSAVSPERGLRRVEARTALSRLSATDTQPSGGYESASFGREGWNPAWNRATPADEEQNFPRYDRTTTVLLLQDAYRNNEIAHGIITRLADYVVHTGIRPQAQTKDRAWNDAAEAFYGEWAKIADYRQRPGVDLYRLQWQCIVDRCIRGESGFIMLANGQLQPIEMDRVQTPDNKQQDQWIRNGVAFSQSGILTGYWICDRSPDGFINTRSAEFVPRENFIHVVYPWRFDQARGVPELASVINKLTHLRNADKYTLLKVKNEAQQFLVVTKEQGGGLANSMPRNSRTTTDSNDNKQSIVAHEWGHLWNMKIGENVKPVGGMTPFGTYVPYLEWEVKTLASALGLPWEFILMVFTEGSFSAQRSALLHALHKIVQWHGDLARAFCQRTWNWRIAKAMKEGDLPLAPKDERGVSQWYRVDWSLPDMGWVDPEAAADAQVTAWKFGKTSLKRVASAEGRDRTDMLAEKADDIRDAIGQAAAVNKAFPEAKVTWRDMISVGSTGALIKASKESDGGIDAKAGKDAEE